jgi:hypothetical protein
MKCSACQDDVFDALDLFPGDVCLACWAASEEGGRVVSANELTAMWMSNVLQKGG